jgi:hypothetical protein
MRRAANDDLGGVSPDEPLPENRRRVTSLVTNVSRCLVQLTRVVRQQAFHTRSRHRNPPLRPSPAVAAVTAAQRNSDDAPVRKGCAMPPRTPRKEPNP